jgi:hypothetical protein
MSRSNSRKARKALEVHKKRGKVKVNGVLFGRGDGERWEVGGYTTNTEVGWLSKLPSEVTV